MERRSYDIEKIFLYVYTFFTIFQIVATFYLERSMVAIPPLVVGIFVGWYLCIKKYGKHQFRVYAMSIMATLGVLMYGMAAESLADTLSPFVVLVIMVGLFENATVLGIVSCTYLILILYHGLYTKSFDVLSIRSWMQVLLQVLGIAVIVYMTWHSMNNSIHMKNKLLETIDELRQAEHTKDEFMANVSHELRTPLNTIRGMSELILREDLPAKVRDEAFHIQMAGRNLQTIVSDVLDYSELQTGELGLDEAYYNFTSIINDVLNIAIAQNEDKNLELIVNCDPTIPRSLIGDSEKIARILYCLVNNAIKFTEKGCVEITASTRKEDYGVNLCISVKDTGIGLTREEKERLFTSFNQIDTRKNRAQGGMGLGLAISRKMLELMNGFLIIKSEPGKGSEFKVVIPQRVEDERPIIALKDQENIHLIYYINQEKYSMVEIRDSYRKMIREMAQKWELSYFRAKSLREFTDRIENGRYTHALITMDEYLELPAYFEELSRKMPVLLVLDRQNDKEVGTNFSKIYKPFYALSIATALNGGKVVQRVDGSHYQTQEFAAPDASVLVVDDNMMNLKVMEGLLRPYEVRLFTATSGEEALKLLDHMHYDLIFMDHMMPKMDGVEALHAIRKKAGKYYREVPIIALTANAMGGAREMFLAEGFQDFVPKPVEISNLERTLKRYLPSDKIVAKPEEEISAEAVPDSEDKPAADISVENQASAISEENTAKDFVVEKSPVTDTCKEKQERRLNEEQGIRYCGGLLSDYLEVLEAYHWDGKQKKVKMQSFYEEENWKDYRVLVHSLKSNSQAIGAERLYEIAKNQELAAKEENREEILKHHEEMLQEYKVVLTEIEGRLERAKLETEQDN